MKTFVAFASLIACVSAGGHLASPSITATNFTFNGTEISAHYAVPDGEGPFPAVVVIPDYPWTTTDPEYAKKRATMIAEEWGFVAFTAEIFGGDQNATDAEGFITARVDAAVAAVAAMDNVDSSMIAVFGYGTPAVLMYAVNGLGSDSVKALVSFHGDIAGDWLPDELKEVGPKLLVLSGGDEFETSLIMDLEKTLDTANATWEITRYSDAGPSFTVKDTDGYNELAEMRSWDSAYKFVLEAFDITAYSNARPDSFDSVMAVEYNDTDGTALKGWLAMPDPAMFSGPYPTVVIFPDWDGVNDYEKERAVALAKLGYVAFAADIYGADKQFIESFQDRGAEVGFYRSNPDIYFSRMQSGVDQVKKVESVDTSDIAVIGYCFGGSGVVLYAINGGVDAKIAVAYHGSFNAFNVTTQAIVPYLLIESGGDDGLHGNQTIMETAFNEGQSEWEITRYAGVGHGFTSFDSGAYDLVADARSWDSFLTYMTEPTKIEITEAPADNSTTAPDSTPATSGNSTEAPGDAPKTAESASSVVSAGVAVVASAILCFM